MTPRNNETMCTWTKKTYQTSSEKNTERATHKKIFTINAFNVYHKNIKLKCHFSQYSQVLCKGYNHALVIFV